MDLMSNKTGNMITGKSQSATGKNKEERNLTINIGNTELSQQETQHRTKTSREGVNPETTEDHIDERYTWKDVTRRNRDRNSHEKKAY